MPAGPGSEEGSSVLDDKKDKSEEIRDLLRSIYRFIDVADEQFTSEDSTWYEETAESDISSEY